MTAPLSGFVDEQELKRTVHRRLLAEQSDVRRTDLAARIGHLLREEHPLLGSDRYARLLEELLDDVAGLGPLERLLADPSITEIMVNGPGTVYIERGGVLERIALELDSASVSRLIERMVAPLGLRVDRSSPMVDARLPDGPRLHAVLPPLAIDGPCLTIRRFRTRRVDLAEFGVVDGPAAFLSWAVAAGANVLVAGGTGAGKTTLLNTLSASIPSQERVVTIEETAELVLEQPHVVRLEARPPNGEGAGGATVRQLVHGALRMRPDRVIVGEVRGGEALDMLQALNTGHDGSMSTIHANGAAEALARLDTLALLADVGLPLAAVRAQLAAALDLVVFVARRGGARHVEAVAEVTADPARVRPLFLRRAERLVAVDVPLRPPRRGTAVTLNPGWFACSTSSASS